ncbi:MAG: hypothetical protein KDA90_01090 [Planctomycetaceae bacterium]|nr:hypothetical protein [Planctomycetaceae bacterium]
MGRIERSREIARRRARKTKLQKLRAAHAAAQTDVEKQAIAEKVARLSPFAVLNQPS